MHQLLAWPVSLPHSRPQLFSSCLAISTPVFTYLSKDLHSLISDMSWRVWAMLSLRATLAMVLLCSVDWIFYWSSFVQFGEAVSGWRDGDAQLTTWNHFDLEWYFSFCLNKCEVAISKNWLCCSNCVWLWAGMQNGYLQNYCCFFQ